MIKIWIPHKWNGLVAIPQEDVDKSKDTKEGLELKCEWEVMTIPLEEIDKRIRFKKLVSRSDGTKIVLVYFWWIKDGGNSNLEQKKLALKTKKQKKVAEAWDKYNALSPEEQDKYRFNN